MFDGSRRRAVVGEHRQSLASDIGPGAIGLLVRQRETLQKAIEWLSPAREGIDIVRFVEVLDWRQSHLFRRHSSTLFAASNRVKRGLAATGRSRIAWKACHWRWSSRNIRRSTRACSAALIPAASRNSVTFLWVIVHLTKRSAGRIVRGCEYCVQLSEVHWRSSERRGFQAISGLGEGGCR